MTNRNYDHHDIGMARDKLIEKRDTALGAAEFEDAVFFSHVIAILFQYDVDIRAHNLEGDPK